MSEPNALTVAVMIGLGYPGEVADSSGTKWTFWVLAMIPFVYILYTLYGPLQAAAGRETPAERTMAMNLGLAIDDMATAIEIYRRAREAGIGTELSL